jgi:hypothetical protein
MSLTPWFLHSYYDIDIKFFLVFELKSLIFPSNITCFTTGPEQGWGFFSLVDAALHHKEKLILSGKIRETFL